MSAPALIASMNPCEWSQRPIFDRCDGRRAYLGAGLGDSAEVVHHVGLGHTNASVTDAEEFILLVSTDTDVELLLSVKDRRFRQ